MVALIAGLAAVALGIIGIIAWWVEFVDLLQGGAPIILILGGALAAYLGSEELKDIKASEGFTDTESNLKQEVESLKEEIKELKEDKIDSGA